MNFDTNSKSFQNFKDAIDNDNTFDTYRRSLNEFLRFHKFKNYDDLLRYGPDDLSELMKSYIGELKNRKLVYNSISTKLNAVELFCDMNKLIWYKRIVRKTLPKNNHKKAGFRPITTEEVKLLLETCENLRDKAIIHYLASTGVRPASIIDPDPLKVGDLIEIENCYALEIYDDSDEAYFVFLHPEARQILDRYLKWRKFNGENVDNDSPLFATFENSTYRKNEFMSTQSVSKMLKVLFKKAGITRKKNGNRFDMAITYCFRKRFNGILKMDNNVNSNIAEKLMAHRRGLDGAYLKPTMEECFREFKKAISELTVDPTQRQKRIIEQKEEEISELQKLRMENESKTSTLKTVLKRLDELESKIEKNTHTKR